MADLFLTRRMFVGSLAASAGVSAFSQSTARTAEALVVAARKQVGMTLNYDPAYTRLAFPGGDVDRAKGVCTDVVIRAYRDAFGLDLQALVNRDMHSAFSAYPKRWGLTRPDKNIDHRRVPNLQTFFARQAAKLPLSSVPQDWKPGDIFTSLIDNRLPHIGIVSNRKTGNRPLVIHNIGGGAREEDMLFSHPLTGHYRWGITG
jgi:uncharacterized protein